MKIVILTVLLSFSFSQGALVNKPKTAGELRIAKISKVNKSQINSDWIIKNFESEPEIAYRIMKDIVNYSGPCPCPYNETKDGRFCGGTSAYSKPNGESPRCYPADFI